MPGFTILPVLDLMGGHVVHGIAGERASYRPIETPLGPADDVLNLARTLLDKASSSSLYVADLDAIERTGDHRQSIARLAAALAPAALWLDAGTDEPAALRRWQRLGLTPVIGSESLKGLDQWQALREAGASILSLDFAQDGFRGPAPLRTMPELWPATVIVMTLARVGSTNGPDLDRLAEIVQAAGETRAVYAAGGVRSLEDLEAVARIGAKGALVATALHRGSLPQNEIAAFLRRRRSL